MRRRVLQAVLVVLVVVLAWVLLRLSDPARFPHDDFVCQWAAARLNLLGQNPYDSDLVLAMQRTVGWPAPFPYRVWYPPWVLSLLAPYALLPYQLGRFVWWIVNIVAVIASADLLWRYYGGDAKWRGVSWIVGATFWPAVADLRTGQTSALMLVGLVGFLHLARRGRWAAAGAVLALATIKPPILHLFWIALLLWVLRERRWTLALGGLASVAALVAIALASNPALLGQFWHMATADGPGQVPSTTGGMLRTLALAFGHDSVALQLLPSLLGMAWLGVHWWRHREAWDWGEQVPILVLVSSVTTFYGWIYDAIVLLIPVTQLAVAVANGTARAPSVVRGYVLVNAAVLAMNVARVEVLLYSWVPLGFLCWYLLARRACLEATPPVLVGTVAR